MSLQKIKGIGRIIDEKLTDAGFNLDNIQSIKLEDLEKIGLSESQSLRLIEDIFKFFDEKKQSTYEKAESKIEEAKDLIIDEAETITDEVETVTEEIKTKIEEKTKVGRYRLKKQLRQKFPNMDKSKFREFFRTNANKYDNLQDMTKAFQSFQEK